MPASERMEAILKSLDKAYSGPLHTVKEWDIKVLPTAIKGILKKYGLANTYDPNIIINFDDELADTFFKAGYELALALGLYCEDTERVIKVDENEIKLALSLLPKEVHFGTGRDEVVMRPRRPEDPYPPIASGPLSIMVDEAYVVGLQAGIAKYRKLLDILGGPTIEKASGRNVRSGTPYETWLCFYENELKRHALKIIDRETMTTFSVNNAVTEYGFLSGVAAYAGTRPLSHCLIPSEMKVTFGTFHKVISAINYGHWIHAGGPSNIGGYAGSVEGAILVGIANDILVTTILRADNSNGNVFDIQKACNTLPKAQWGNSIATQATARNTSIMADRITNQISGPMTKDLFYESAVGLMNLSVSGAAKSTLPRTAGGRYVNYITPVEAWWCAQVFKSCAGMTRKTANEFAKAILPKYQDNLAKPSRGLPCNECFNFTTLEPSPEYFQLYKTIEKEMIDLGMPLEKYQVL
ncbi:MAG: monomethylamine:corrinoid methyltransferase [Synergistaceae bacterium]|nr:monomethylamine:corrinoid methyltransferase [Synergistaceae bacterium]